ncbi:MAG: SDR family oxidoreductase [Salinisphaeraceae bacterium]|nr:SDR family oxidoreductase [Salinisphaeraceae bacterium]
MSKKVVLITGCSSGIGRALALAYHARGDQVYATARRPETLDALPETIHRLALDVNNQSAITQAIERITREAGRIDVVVNNAGFGLMGPLAELPATAIREQLDTNVVAPVALTQATLPLLREAARVNKSARVANIGSVSGILTTPFSGAYCASKAAIHAVSDALRMELAPFGIHVITIQPGAIRSEFGNNSAESVSRWLRPDSLYMPIKSAIEARAQASQNDPTSAEDFAEVFIKQVMRDQPEPVIRIGNASRMMPFLKRWLPTKRLDRILSKRFKLDQLD